LLISTLFLLLHISIAYAGDIAVIVNVKYTDHDLSASDIMKIYQGKKAGWKTVDLVKDNEIRQKFSETILKKDADKMERYYIRRSLSGKGQPPKVFDNEDEVKAFIARTQHSIGYISKDKVDDTIKVVYEF
jgi:ABC-type phosphate transport system substrate-binding protein